MTKCSNIRTPLIGLVLSAMLAIPTLAAAQTSATPQQPGGMMKDGKMMPMGDGQMGGKMQMPAKMSRHKPGCCKGMHNKSAGHHSHHRTKAKHVEARRAPPAMPNAKLAQPKAAPMPM